MPFDAAETGASSDRSFELGDDVLNLLDLGGGKVRWDRTPAPGQPGDSTQSKTALIELHGGFGASHRIVRGLGQRLNPAGDTAYGQSVSRSNPGHHAYAENVSAQFEGLTYPAGRITYLDMGSLVARSRSFRVGGYANSRVGANGAGIGAVGGGSFNDTPQRIIEFNSLLYVLCGRYTFTISPDLDTPVVAGVRDHGAAARGRSGDVFGNALGVALGASHVAEWLVGSTSQTSTVTGTPVVATFTSNGDVQPYIVPDNVTSLAVELQGAKGESGANGAKAVFTLAVTPGETLYLSPGRSGANGGYGGGGAGTYRGGGRSDVRQGGSDTGHIVGVAAGGGGGAGGSGGAPDGVNGSGGGDANDGGGGGATQAGVGDGGTTGFSTAGNPGSGFDGGSGYGGGGGGWKGGGGGAQQGFDGDDASHGPGSGGGGSSYVNPLVGSSIVYTGNYATIDGDGRIIVTATPVTTQVSENNSGWEQADLNFDVYRTGVRGRLFAALGNVVYNVEQGEDPLDSVSYLPSNGEIISEVSDPVRELVEYAQALVAGTGRGARTLDADRQYHGVPITEQVRSSSSDYDGRALLAKGAILYHATRQGIYMIVPGSPPRSVGPELLHHNETPYAGMEWGVPTVSGDWMAWPAYLPDSGDSVVFLARMRDQEDIGTGPVVWHDVYFLEGRECRCVGLWGGSDDHQPRLFFGAGASDGPFQVGWVDLGVGGGPEPFTSQGRPALTGFIESPLDDFGLPSVRKVVERYEIPYLRHADAANYLVVSAKGGNDGEFVPLVTSTDEAASPERIVDEGFVRVFAPTDEDSLIATELAVRYDFTQDIGAEAANWLIAQGTAALYYTEVPDTVDVIQTVVDAKSQVVADIEQFIDALRAKHVGSTVRQKNGPDGVDRYVRVVAIKATTIEAGADAESRTGIELTLREVLT